MYVLATEEWKMSEVDSVLFLDLGRSIDALSA